MRSMPKIGVIDDSDSIRALMKTQMSARGFDVKTYASGLHYLECLENETRGSETLDCILLDYMMPDMDGLEVFREIHALSPSIPVIMTTAVDKRQLLVEFMRLGGADFALKPIDFDVLETQVTRALRAAKKEREAAEATAEAIRLKAEFIANTSHEIRTPLTAISGFVDRLHRRASPGYTLSERDVLTISTIADNVEHLNFIVSDILDLSKIQSGKMGIRSAVVSLNRLIAQTLDSLSVRVPSGVSLVNASEGVPERQVNGDAVRIRQVLTNLLANAFNSTSQGEIVVGLCDRESPTDEVTVYVRDTGCGIPLCAREIIFHAFSQVDGSDTRSLGGSGLGLTISREIMAAHDGRLWLESSEEGVGSEFRLTFPLIENLEVANG